MLGDLLVERADRAAAGPVSGNGRIAPDTVNIRRPQG